MSEDVVSEGRPKRRTGALQSRALRTSGWAVLLVITAASSLAMGVIAAAALLIAEPVFVPFVGLVMLAYVCSGAEALFWPGSPVGLWANFAVPASIGLALLIAALMTVGGWQGLLLGMLLAALSGVLFHGALRSMRRRGKLRTRPGARALAVVMMVFFMLGILPGFWLGRDVPAEPFAALSIARPPVRPEENGYPLIVEMRERFAPGLGRDLSRIAWQEVASATGRPEELTAARELLARCEGCLEAADRMLERPRFAPPMAETPAEWYDKVFTDDWHSCCRDLSALMELDSLIALRTGRFKQARARVEDMLRFGRLMKQDADRFETTRCARGVTARGLVQLRRVAGAVDLARGPLREYMALLPGEDELRSAMRRGLALDWHYARAMLKAMADGTFLSFGEDGKDDSVLRLRCIFREPLLFIVKPNMSGNALGRKFVAAAGGLGRFQAGSFRDMSAEPGWPQTWRNPLGFCMADILLPSLGWYRDLHWRGVAEVRMTRVFLALRCYQLERGRLPAALSELAPDYLDEMPLDPFTEAPFGYDPEADPPRIWSVGPDQQQDAPDAEDADDVVIELTFAAEQAQHGDTGTTERTQPLR